jgi:uncharacterized protein YebE (UPF0316 family)
MYEGTNISLRPTFNSVSIGTYIIRYSWTTIKQARRLAADRMIETVVYVVGVRLVK